MHRVIKAKVTKPAPANAKLWQRVFNIVVQTNNDVRPHEALTDAPLVSRRHPSARPLPTRSTPLRYPGHFNVRCESTADTFRIHHGQQFFIQSHNDEVIGLEAVRHGLWNEFYYATLPGRFSERSRIIIGAPFLRNDRSRCFRKKVSDLPDCSKRSRRGGVSYA